MRLRTASSLIAFPHDDRIAVYNFLSKSSVVCGGQDLNWLTAAPEWTHVDEFAQKTPGVARDVVKQTLGQLVDLGMLVEEGSETALRDEAYSQEWKMGRAAAFCHFHALDNAFLDSQTSIRSQVEQAKNEPSPALFWGNNGTKTALPDPGVTVEPELFDVMRRRRTNRIGLPKPINFQQISDCLYAGLGITGFVRAPAATLPLKMTPSGGARNPFEAFVFARNVEGLDPGQYHYSAIDHSLQAVSHEPVQEFASLLGGQDWADSMPALIVLVASLERTAWKYQNSNAYRVVLIEAGHIAQNMMLAGTGHQLTVCPTAALAHTKLKSLLKLNSITDEPVYAIALGYPGHDPDEVISVETYLEQQKATQNRVPA